MRSLDIYNQYLHVEQSLDVSLGRLHVLPEHQAEDEEGYLLWRGPRNEIQAVKCSRTFSGCGYCYRLDEAFKDAEEELGQAQRALAKGDLRACQGYVEEAVTIMEPWGGNDGTHAALLAVKKLVRLAGPKTPLRRINREEVMDSYVYSGPDEYGLGGDELRQVLSRLALYGWAYEAYQNL